MECRTDFAKYNSSCRTVENMFVKVHGSAERRPGTYYVATAESDATTRPPIAGVTGISTPQELQDMLNDLDGDYELLNDIDMTGFEWEPVGASNVAPFTGTFDGRYFTISNLTIVANAPPTWANSGLFGRIDAGATARRTILTNVSITITHGSSQSFGLFCGSIYGTVTECYAQGTIRRTVTHTFLDGTGGFTGVIGDSGVISKCAADVGITSAVGFTGVGGFVGSSTGAGTHTITDCYSVGTLDASESASDRRISGTGGFMDSAEYLNTPDHHIVVENCYCAVQIKGKENTSPPRIGGFLAEFTITPNGDADQDFTSCYWDNDVGNVIEDRVGDLFDCGRLWSTEDEGNLPADEVLKSTTTAMYQQATYSGWDFTDVWQIDEGSAYPIHQWYAYWSGSSGITGTIRLIPFEISTDDSYVLEMGNKYMRFYKDGS
jgi:hypothetical protein